MKKVIIIGAGLAGLSSAVELLVKGYTPHILEKNQQVGGRTSSWYENGMKVECGLHRYLGFYEALPKLLEKCNIDFDDVFEWMDEIEIQLPNDKANAIFAMSPTRKPIDTIMDSLGNNDFISPTQKIKLAKFIATGLALYKSNPEELDKKNIKDYAKEEGLDDETIHRIIEPFSTGLFFLPIENYSAYVFFGSIGPYLSRIHKLGEAAFKGGMTDVMTNPIAQFIRKKGGIIDLGVEVKEILTKDSKVVGIKSNIGEIKANNIILATDIGNAQKIIEKSLKKEYSFESFLKLKTMPAMTVQLELRKPSRETDRVTFTPKSDWSCFAEQSRTTFKHSKGRLSVILSNPKRFMDLTPLEVIEKVVSEAKKFDLDLSNINSSKVVYLESDFYSLSPGSEKLRPMQETTIDGLTLAGDYTKQKYLATMEGAVISGILAAENVHKKNKS
jgi:15-cis-phytoene desaturase